MKERAETVLQTIRPFLQVDGGDIEFVRWNGEHGILEVRFLGACVTCALLPLTLRAGVERVMMLGIPEVKRVEAVSAEG